MEATINISRLMGRIDNLAKVGAVQGGGNTRLALSDADKAGRDLVVGWMKALGLDVSIDGIGNVVGVRAGDADQAPVMMGSHIDTVAVGGRFDGALGVLAGLEVVEALNDGGVSTKHPLAVAFFTNEEGARFAPDMMGSLVLAGGLPLEKALETVSIDGARLGDELARIGYAGRVGEFPASIHAYIELHVEQGPVLDREGVTIGAVEGVQGISWHEFVLKGVANHAGTTPMNLRNDAAYGAAAITQFVRDLATKMGDGHVATVGSINLMPNLINVIPESATMTVDMRNISEGALADSENALFKFVEDLVAREGLIIERRQLARFEPVGFDADLIQLVDETARRRGHSVRRMPSGAGHDAQMLAAICPSCMIFVPSIDGISHNRQEDTNMSDIEAGANVLLDVAVTLSSGA